MSEPEFFVLPMPEDVDYWERNMAAGLHQPAPVVNGQPSEEDEHSSWRPVNLADERYAMKPDPPAIHGLLYRAKRHVISGPPESAKTLIAYLLLLEALRQQQPIAIVDFEMGATAARLLLDELGATRDELAAIYYVEPEAPPSPDNIESLLAHGAQYVLLDAAAGAYDTSGLDDNARKDAEKFARAWIRPLWTEGVATLVIDHVTKNIDTRGKFTIGSERKVGQADVHLSLEALKPLSRGGTGLVKIHVHKDRPGFLIRPTAVVLDLRSDEQHRVTTTFRDPHPTDEAGGFRPTIYMERISLELEKHVEPLSTNEVEEAVKGKREYIRDGLAALVREGFVEESEGPRNSHLYLWITRYRQADDDLAPTSPPPRPGEVPVTSSDLAPVSPPPTGGRGEDGEHGSAVGEADLAPPLDVHDPAIQKLLDEP